VVSYGSGLNCHWTNVAQPDYFISKKIQAIDCPLHTLPRLAQGTTWS